MPHVITTPGSSTSLTSMGSIFGQTARPRGRLRKARLLRRDDRGGDVGLYAASRLPAGRPEDVAEPVTPPRRRSHVLGDRDVFARLQLPDVEGIHRLGQPGV